MQRRFKSKVRDFNKFKFKRIGIDTVRNGVRLEEKAYARKMNPLTMVASLRNLDQADQHFNGLSIQDLILPGQ